MVPAITASDLILQRTAGWRPLLRGLVVLWPSLPPSSRFNGRLPPRVAAGAQLVLGRDRQTRDTADGVGDARFPSSCRQTPEWWFWTPRGGTVHRVRDDVCHRHVGRAMERVRAEGKLNHRVQEVQECKGCGRRVLLTLQRP